MPQRMIRNSRNVLSRLGFMTSVICPHTLSTRPLVVSDTSRITVRIVKALKKLLFWNGIYRLDGAASVSHSMRNLRIYKGIKDHFSCSIVCLGCSPTTLESI